MTDPRDPSAPPAEVSHLVRQRIEARSRRDWAAADALKAQIETLGWRVVDRGTRSSVTRAAPVDIAVEGETRYGSAASMPSRLDEPATHAWTVVVPASETPAQTSSLLAALRRRAPAGVQVVIVANDPSEAQQAALRPGAADLAVIGDEAPEILRTAARLGYAAALNIAMRRVGGELVILTDGSAWPEGDAFSPLASALADPDVAVAGAFGLKSDDPGNFRPASLTISSETSCGAILGSWLAFRRSDLVELGPLDEHFMAAAWLDVWWSLRLRAGQEPDFGPDFDPDLASSAPDAAEGEDTATDVEIAADLPMDLNLPVPRRAVRLDLPLGGPGPVWPPARSRLARRNMYRVIDRFGWRQDLF